ncbi:MAG: DnaD domain protein [Lachnospiraceae bacterium]|nr:DnaD domain protein [Lachnospiraceae bacterium]
MKIRTSKTAQTAVSNEFIDELMVRTNGEYVKVYLYMLRHAGEDVSEDDIADALELTGGDVKRAISFLSKNGAFGDSLENESNDTEKSDVVQIQDDVDFKALLHELQCYIGKTFNNTEAEIVAYMYNRLGMPTELIEYLFEVCKQKKKTSLRYMEKVAQRWYEKGIKNVDDAKRDEELYAEEISSVKSYFGLSSRDLAKPETEYVMRWIREYKMPPDLIKEACRRTVLGTGKATFSYADSILKVWKEKGVVSAEQLKALDEEHKAEQEKKRRTRSASNSNTKNGFHNFEQREDSLDRDILKKFDDLTK